MQLVPHPIKDQFDEFENHWACLSLPPFSPPGNELPLGIRRFLELLQSMGFPACVWQGTSIPSSGGISRPKLYPPSWLLSAYPLSSFSNHSEPGQGKGEPTRFRNFQKITVLCLLFKTWQQNACARATYKVFPGRIHTIEARPPSWPLCAWLLGSRPCISDKTSFSSLRRLMSFSFSPSSSLPPAAGCLWREESRPLSLGSQATKTTDSASGLGIQIGGLVTLKSFSAELNPIPYPGFYS